MQMQRNLRSEIMFVAVKVTRLLIGGMQYMKGSRVEDDINVAARAHRVFRRVQNR